ncbi:MAG TPA: TolC family protein [Verrucomicrobiae bacterium]|nr:TolC family protein [Verrucomicrobiae bacterium]
MYRWVTIIALAGLAGCARFHPRPLSPAETAASLDARSLDSPAFREFLEKNLRRQFDAWPPKSWDFEMLNLAALYYHPSLDVARAQWQVALGGKITAAARPNPTASVEPGYDFNSTGLSPWLPLITFDIPLETAGKRGYRKAQAQRLSESARLNIATAAWQVHSNLRASLIDFIAARQREQLLQEQMSWQEKIVQSLEQRLQAGAVSRSELTLVRIALEKIRLELTDAQRQNAEARIRVADAIGVSAKALEGLDLNYDLSVRPAVAAELATADAREQALRGRADILAALAEYAASQSALQLEIAKQYPDIHLGPGYQYDHGEHTFTLALTAELPILNQNQGPIAEAAARRAETAARFVALQAKVITEIDRAVAAYRVTQNNLSTLEFLASAQERQTEAVAAQVQAGAVEPLDLLNSQIELGASKLLQLDSRVKFQQAFATLEDAIQRPLDSIQPPLYEQSQRPQAMKGTQP